MPGSRPRPPRRRADEPLREGAKLDLPADARIQATGKRKTSVARVVVAPGGGEIKVNRRALEEYFPRSLPSDRRAPGARDLRVREPGRRERSRPRRRHLRPGRRGAPWHRPRAGRDRPRAPRRAQAPRACSRATPAPRSAARPGSRRPASGPSSQALASGRVAAKLFGTDGVRGVAGEALTAELAVALGRAAADEARAERPQVLIVRDTRESGPMLEAGLAAGHRAGGRRRAGRRRRCRRPPPRFSCAGWAWTWQWSSPPPTTPGATTASSSSGATARSCPTSPRRAWRRRSRPRPGPPAAVGTIRELHGALDDYLRELAGAFRARSQRACTWSSTAPTARPTARRRPIFERLGARRRGAVRRPRRAQHQRGLRLDPPRGPGASAWSERRRPRASRTTATAIG